MTVDQQEVISISVSEAEGNIKIHAQSYEVSLNEKQNEGLDILSHQTQNNGPALIDVTGGKESHQQSYEVDEVDEFFDAEQDTPSAQSVKMLDNNYKPLKSKSAVARSELPAQKDPSVKPGLWQIIKGSIGKDISEITVPVFFNEPLSILQK